MPLMDILLCRSASTEVFESEKIDEKSRWVEYEAIIHLIRKYRSHKVM